MARICNRNRSRSRSRARARKSSTVPSGARRPAGDAEATATARAAATTTGGGGARTATSLPRAEWCVCLLAAISALGLGPVRCADAAAVAGAGLGSFSSYGTAPTLASVVGVIGAVALVLMLSHLVMTCVGGSRAAEYEDAVATLKEQHASEMAKERRKHASEQLAKDADIARLLKADDWKAKYFELVKSFYPEGLNTFLADKYINSWALFSAVFPRERATAMQDIAQRITHTLEEARVTELLPLLWNEQHWHPQVPGGGMHWNWDNWLDGSGGDRRAKVELADGTTGGTPGFDGIKYQTLRQPLLGIFRGVQGMAGELVELVQEQCNRVFDLIPGTIPEAKVQPVAAGKDLKQHVPPCFEGKGVSDVVASADAAAKVRAAIKVLREHKRNGTLRTKLHVSDAEADDLLANMDSAKLRDEGKVSYWWWMYAALVLASEAFHESVASLFAGLAAVVVRHGNLKSPHRSFAKMNADYRSMPQPQIASVKDVLRMTLILDEFDVLAPCMDLIRGAFTIRELKHRLAEPTHDLLLIVDLPGANEGLLGEIQLSFRAVDLMKRFSHSGYNLLRCDLSDEGGGNIREFMMLAYTLPRDNQADCLGGYRTRSKDEIQLKPVFK